MSMLLISIIIHYLHITISKRITHYCVVEDHYACSTEETFLQDFLENFEEMFLLYNMDQWYNDYRLQMVWYSYIPNQF